MLFKKKKLKNRIMSNEDQEQKNLIKFLKEHIGAPLFILIVGMLITYFFLNPYYDNQKKEEETKKEIAYHFDQANFF
jgi:hypothetical protein